MIDFKDIVETKNEIKEISDFISYVQLTAPVNLYIRNIDKNITETFNNLYGKYYSFDRKQIVHSWENNKTSFYVELQIGKNGIGATPGGGNIKTYQYLYERSEYTIENYGIKGLFGDVFDNNEIYNKVYEKSSKRGKELLETLKKIKEEVNIQPAKTKEIIMKIVPTDYEKEIFNLSDNEFISLNFYDDIEYNYHRLVIKVYINQNGKERVELFEVANLDPKNEKDYLYCLFMYYHINEFKQLLNDYIEQTKEEKEKWSKFYELFNAEFGKYLVLNKL